MQFYSGNRGDGRSKKMAPVIEVRDTLSLDSRCSTLLGNPRRQAARYGLWRIISRAEWGMQLVCDDVGCSVIFRARASLLRHPPSLILATSSFLPMHELSFQPVDSSPTSPLRSTTCSAASPASSVDTLHSAVHSEIHCICSLLPRYPIPTAL